MRETPATDAGEYARAGELIREYRRERWRWWDPLGRLTLMALRMEAWDVILREKRRGRTERERRGRTANGACESRGSDGR
jgi:hypothetical protein